MTPTLTADQVRTLRELEAKATPGPWTAYDNHIDLPGVGAVPFDTDNPMAGDSSADTHFIAATRNHLPSLLEAAAQLATVTQERDELQAENAELRGKISGAQQ